MVSVTLFYLLTQEVVTQLFVSCQFIQQAFLFYVRFSMHYMSQQKG